MACPYPRGPPDFAVYDIVKPSYAQDRHRESCESLDFAAVLLSELPGFRIIHATDRTSESEIGVHIKSDTINCYYNIKLELYNIFGDNFKFKIFIF